MPGQRAESGSAPIGLITIILTLIGWSSIPLFLKHFTHLIDGWTANGWRYGISAAIWFPAIVLAWRRRALPRSLWRAALVPSLFNAAGQLCFALAPYHIGPGLMTFALRMQIVFVTAGAAVLFASERRIVRTPGFLAGVALVILGTSGTIFFNPAGIGGATAFGVVLSVTAGLLYACYALSVRHFMQGVNPLTAFAVISQYTAIALLPPMFIWGESGASHWWHGSKVLELAGSEVALLALSSVIGIGLGHTFYYVSIARLGVAVSSGVVQLQPILVSIASMAIFGERMTGPQWACGGAAIAGAGIILYAQHRLGRNASPSLPPEVREFEMLPVDADVAAAVAEDEPAPKA
jgi:drug/metabolite transporter (DMT)-like permease